MDLRNIRDRVADVMKKTGQDEILTRSAALAFYTALSMAPLVILLISFLATLDLDLQEQLLNEVGRLIGAETQRLMHGVIERSNERPDLTSLSGWFGSITLFTASSLIFVQMQKTLNLIFNAGLPPSSEDGRWKKIKNVLLRRFASFGTVLSFIFVVIASLAASSAISYFFHGDGWWLRWISFGSDLGLFTVIFSMMFKWMPDRRPLNRACAAGGALTALLFTGGKILISLYIGQTAVGSAYGAAGSLVVLLVWMYYSSFIIFVGAEVSSVLWDRAEFDPELSADRRFRTKALRRESGRESA